MATAITTWDDLISHLIDWCGANPSQEAKRDARKASLNGLRAFTTASNWSYFYQLGRVVCSQPYADGAVAYDHTGGTYERLVTLTGGVWPTWAAQGSVIIGQVRYDVAVRVSDTQVTLTTATNPGADLAALTAYQLIRDTYPLPADFRAMGMVILVGKSVILEVDHPNTWLHRQRVFHGVSEPRVYTITGSPDNVSGMTVRLWPPPNLAHQIDMLYVRHPRQMKVDLVCQGSASVTGGSATVNGNGTGWTSRLVGSIFRVGVDVTKPAGGWSSDNLPQIERVITAVPSSTQLTLDDVSPVTAGSAKYSVSDPVDVEPGSMLTALFRSCEAEMAQTRHMKDRMEVQKAYQHELILSREADSRNFRDEAAGRGGGVWPVPLRYMPLGPDM